MSQMTCHACEIAVEATFPTARLANLPIEHQRFIEIFVLASGNLKEIAEQTGVSYPTVRSRLDKVIAALWVRRDRPHAKDKGHDPGCGERKETHSRSRRQVNQGHLTRMMLMSAET